MQKRISGFTIVELLIVIVVIAILAAITIFAFTGIQDRAKASAAQSAAAQAKKKLEVYKYGDGNGSYPATGSLALAGLNESDGYQYTSNGATFCVTASNGNKSYKATDTADPVQGGCVGHTQGGAVTIMNLVTNPGFETNTADWTSNSATISRTTAEAHSGNASVQVVASPGNNNYGLTSGNNMIPSPTGQTYSVSAWVKAAAGINLALRSDEYNGSTYVTGTGTMFTTTGNWQRVSLNQSINSGTQLRVYVRMSNESVSRTYFVDDVFVTQGTTLYGYADGNSSGWQWTGTQNNSTSTGPAI